MQEPERTSVKDRRQACENEDFEASVRQHIRLKNGLQGTIPADRITENGSPVCGTVINKFWHVNCLIAVRCEIIDGLWECA